MYDSNSSIEEESFHQLFITVLYGNDLEVLYNPHCRSLYLMECIKEKSECGSQVKLDLMNTRGKLTNVFAEKNLREYASSFLKGRKKYVLIKLIELEEEGPDGEKYIKYESLLNNVSERFPRVADRLGRLSTQRLSPFNLKSKKVTPEVSKPSPPSNKDSNKAKVSSKTIKFK